MSFRERAEAIGHSCGKKLGRSGVRSWYASPSSISESISTEPAKPAAINRAIDRVLKTVEFPASPDDITIVRDPDALDCLQKLYPMARFYRCCFAGSVEIGFRMLDGSRTNFATPRTTERFAARGGRLLRSARERHFFRWYPQCRGPRVYIICSAYIDRRSRYSGWERCSVHVLKSPDFVPDRVPSARWCRSVPEAKSIHIGMP